MSSSKLRKLPGTYQTNIRGYRMPSAARPSGQDIEGWYVRELGPAHPRQLWHLTTQSATRADITHPEGGVGSFYTADAGENIWECLRRQTPWLDDMKEPGPFIRMALAPGLYHPRMARPLALESDAGLILPKADIETRYLTSAQNQLESLIDMLRAICRVVQPEPETLGVYGHEIRNLLILAATEIEMHWRVILTANGQSDQRSTKDYVKLADALLLRDYSVHFLPCPGIGPIKPFEGWDPKATTKSLAWYEAYNGVKHNREFEFKKASLGNAFAAIAACVVMLVAQFGGHVLTSAARRFVEVETPIWPVEDMYLCPVSDEGWQPIFHPAF